MFNIKMYTDGACKGNPGPGGAAAILMCGNNTKELTQFEAHTTNGRMEVLGVLIGLKALKNPCKITLTSDSQFVVKAFSEGWLNNWEAKGWRKADKKPVANADLWQEIFELAKTHTINAVWTKGHAHDPLNNRADELADFCVREKL